MKDASGGHLPLKVVPSEDVTDRIDDASPDSAGVSTECCQAPVLLVRGRSDVDLPQPTDRLALRQATAIDPQQFTECCRIASIRLAVAPVVRLDQDHLVATVVS